MHALSIRLPRVSHIALGAGALLTSGLVVACGHGAAAGQSSSTTGNGDQSPVKFSQCMRDHGVDFPDPKSNGNGGFSLKIQGGTGPGKINPDDPKFQQAQEACKKYLPNGGQLSPEQQAQAQQNALKFAQCMRDHGIDIPDPQTSGGGVKIQGPGNINPDDPKFQQAQQACEKYLAIPGGGPGPSTQKSGG